MALAQDDWPVYGLKTAQLVQNCAPPVLYVPCGIARGCRGKRLRERGRLLRGKQRGDQTQSMQTHRRAIPAGRAASVWVVRALRNSAEVRGRMVKGEGGEAGCSAGSEWATTRRAR